jgi:hypothetical protein
MERLSSRRDDFIGGGDPTRDPTSGDGDRAVVLLYEKGFVETAERRKRSVRECRNRREKYVRGEVGRAEIIDGLANGAE